MPRFGTVDHLAQEFIVNSIVNRRLCSATFMALVAALPGTAFSLVCLGALPVLVICMQDWALQWSSANVKPLPCCRMASMGEQWVQWL